MKVKGFTKHGKILCLFIFLMGILHPMQTSHGNPPAEKKKAEIPMTGVTIVSLDAPLRATIGRKVNIEIVAGNERATKVTTILTVTCPTTKQQIGREAETLEALTSQKITYTWNTEGFKEGTYVIQAELEKVPDETVLDDNRRQIEILLQP